MTCISAITNGEPLSPLPVTHSLTHTHTHSHTNSSSDGDKDGKGIGGCIFSVEEELRFSNRFEEGYDLYDPKYEAWLKINHPDAVNKCSTNVFLPIMSSMPVLPHASLLFLLQYLDLSLPITCTRQALQHPLIPLY